MAKWFKTVHAKATALVLAAASGALLSAGVGAQAPDAAAQKQARLAALKESIAHNQAALKTYTWIETTTISLKGEVKKQEQKQCIYGADGKVQKTPVPGSAAPAQAASQPQGRRRGGAVKKAIVEEKVGDMKEYMEKVAELVKEYVPPEPQRIQAVEAAGNVGFQGKPGAPATLTLKNYVKTGDSLAIGFDQTSKKIQTYNVASYVEKPDDDAVTLAVTFGSLDDGTSYAQQTLLDVKKKKIQVNVTNTGYRKSP